MSFDANCVSHPLPLSSPVVQNERRVLADTKLVTATIHQKPLPLRRCVATYSKQGKIRIVQPHARHLDAFRDAVKLQLDHETFPVFSIEVSVLVSIYIFIRRPNYHYVGCKRTNELKKDMADCHVTGGDIDNYIKFVLDALNKTVYADDKQVSSVFCEKRWELDHNSDGKTSIVVQQRVK